MCEVIEFENEKRRRATGGKARRQVAAPWEERRKKDKAAIEGTEFKTVGNVIQDLLERLKSK